MDFHSLTVGELYAAHVGEHSHLIGDRSESVDVHVRIATSLEKSRGYLLEMEEASASVLSSLKQGTEHLGLAQDKARRTGMFYERFDVDSRSMLHGRRTVRCDREGLLWCAVLGIAILVLVIVLAVKI